MSSANAILASFEILSQYKAKKLTEPDPQLIVLAKMRNEIDIEIDQSIDSSEGRPKPEYDKLWFLTPEKCTDSCPVPEN